MAKISELATSLSEFMFSHDFEAWCMLRRIPDVTAYLSRDIASRPGYWITYVQSFNAPEGASLIKEIVLCSQG